jgi:hypothetical protein
MTTMLCIAGWMYLLVAFCLSRSQMRLTVRGMIASEVVGSFMFLGALLGTFDWSGIHIGFILYSIPLLVMGWGVGKIGERVGNHPISIILGGAIAPIAGLFAMIFLVDVVKVLFPTPPEIGRYTPIILFTIAMILSGTFISGLFLLIFGMFEPLPKIDEEVEHP